MLSRLCINIKQISPIESVENFVIVFLLPEKEITNEFLNDLVFKSNFAHKNHKIL